MEPRAAMKYFRIGDWWQQCWCKNL